MRTIFEMILGILVTVLQASLRALVSTAGVVIVAAVVVLIGVWFVRRLARPKARPAKSVDVIPIDR